MKNGLPEHPAKFSAPILAEILDILGTYPPAPGEILDPFAGIGGIHELRRHRYITVGVELEPEWAFQHERTMVGNATNLPPQWKGRFAAVITSPPYANRMADSYAGDAKGSRRHTYRIYLRRALTQGSAAGMQWGADYRNEMTLFIEEARQVLQPGGLFIINVKDHVRGDAVVEVSKWFGEKVDKWGFLFIEKREVPCGGLRHGANAAARVDHEDVWVFRKPPDTRSG